MSVKKCPAPPRYDDAFKTGAIKMVTDQNRSVTAVAQDLGICPDTLRSWIKKSGVHPDTLSRSNSSKQRELEAEIRSLKKQITEKDEAISILKKSIGILSIP